MVFACAALALGMLDRQSLHDDDVVVVVIVRDADDCRNIFLPLRTVVADSTAVSVPSIADIDPNLWVAGEDLTLSYCWWHHLPW
jgi:hypothetical protein